MWSEEEFENIHEDDRRKKIPEWILNMSMEELKAEEERLYKESKATPMKKKPEFKSSIKVNL